MNPFAFQTPDEAIDALANRLSIVGTETASLSYAQAGRIVAQSITSDRDSPAADVSAMDGYAMAGEMRRNVPLRIVGESAAGTAPPQTSPSDLRSGVVRIFTGAIVPSHCDRVVKREDVQESPPSEGSPLGEIVMGDEVIVPAGQHIRRRGENLREGGVAIPSGTALHPPALAVAASVGADRVDWFRNVRVAVISTGNELVPPFESPVQSPLEKASRKLADWQIRNSNVVAIAGLLSSRSYIQTDAMPAVADDVATLRSRIDEAIRSHDVVLLSGGVSMGDHDHVPAVIESLGGKVVFHKLPLRPGKPILAATMTIDGQTKLLLGLPGNPVSATINTVRFALPLIDRIAGKRQWRPRCPSVLVSEPDAKTLPLTWLRPVRLNPDGTVALLSSQGSGDSIALVASDGFIEQPANQYGGGPWRLFLWH